jgi:hypothetical protein
VETIGGKMKRGIVFIMLMLMLCLTLPALPALAGAGIAVGPSTIDLDAVRGAEYNTSVSVLNSGDDTTDFTFSAQGEAADWMSLSYKGEPASRVTVAPDVRVTIQVNVSVPGDAANRKYTSKIVFTSVPPALTTGQAVSVSAAATININVTGTQTISGKVNGASTEDTELGMPLVLRVFFQNTGNVAVAPLIDVTINRNGEKVDNFNYSNTSMKPNQGDFIDVQWDTSQHEPGDYTAKVNVLLEGSQIYSQELPFKILPLGSLTRSGEIRDIQVIGSPRLGSVSKVEALFENTGAADVMAKLTGEVYLDDNLAQTLGGDQVLVEKGKQATLSAYFTPSQEGKYTLKAQVDFGGKKTDIKEITLDVKAPQTTTSNTGTVSQASTQASEIKQPPTQTESSTGNGFNLSSLPWLYIGGGVGVVLIIIIIIFLMSKR